KERQAFTLFCPSHIQNLNAHRANVQLAYSELGVERWTLSVVVLLTSPGGEASGLSRLARDRRSGDTSDNPPSYCFSFSSGRRPMPAIRAAGKENSNQ